MIKLSQKRTCEGCRTLKMDQYISKCELGYGFDKHFKPLEPCPKPNSFVELIECKEWYKK